MSDATASEPEILTISSKYGTFLYVVTEVPCEIGGRGFLVRRLSGGETYQLTVGEPRECSCSCKGFLVFGRCKHLFLILEKLAREKK